MRLTEADILEETVNAEEAAVETRVANIRVNVTTIVDIWVTLFTSAERPAEDLLDRVPRGTHRVIIRSLEWTT